MAAPRSNRTTPYLCAVLLGALATACGTEPTGVAEVSSDPRLSLAAEGVGPVVLIGAGDIAECSGDADEATAQLLDAELASNPNATVFTLGDNAYPSGSAADFANCYDPTWGRHLQSTRATLGDEDYEASSIGQPAFDYFGAANLGGVGKGYYSYDIGAWHIVVLNDQIDKTAGSPQLSWLQQDLAANTQSCTLAMFHEPRFWSSNGGGVSSSRRPLWDEMYDGGVDVVLNGHQHMYERFAPQDPDQNLDLENGIREFIVGTGGRGHYHPSNVQLNSEVREFDTYGVLKLTLSEGAYAWEFVPIAGSTFTDTGSFTCHDTQGNQPPTAVPGGPYQAEPGDIVQFDGSGSSDPDPNDQVVGWEWDYGDGNTGSGEKPTHAYAGEGSYTVTLVVEDAQGTFSPPATTTAEIGEIIISDITLDTRILNSGKVRLDWARAAGDRVDIERNGVITRSTTNDGATIDTPNPTGSYTYRICEQASGTCSNSSMVVYGGSPPNNPPTSDPGGPYAGEVNVAVQFDGGASSDPENGPLTYDWDFGDGNTGSGPTPMHTYTSINTFTVLLTVTDDAGNMDGPVATEVNIEADSPPTADAGGPYSGQPNASVQFDGTASFDPGNGPITSYQWNFGDGNSGTGATPTHTYASAGNYSVTLIVMDSQNQPSQPYTTTANIEVGSNITLVTELKSNGRARLDWTGAAGGRVDIERNGIIHRSTTNDGATQDNLPGPGSYDYRICEQGTGVCSNTSTVVVP